MRPFREVSRVVEREPGRFDAAVDPEWSIGGKPNGGYLLAMLGRAATAVTDHDHVIAASAHYLRSPDPGPAVIEAEVLRPGRSTSQVRAGLVAGGTRCVEGLFTVSTLPAGSTPHWDRGVPAVGAVPFDECVRLPSIGVRGQRVAILDQVETRLEPETARFRQGEPTGVGELRGWLALPGDEPFDPVSLLFAVDGFPPATFDIALSGWVPTLELTAYVRALPAPGPVRILQRAQLIESGRVDEVCFVWDRAGRLVAQGTQLAGIRLG